MENALESHTFSTLVTAPWFLAVVGGFIILGIALAYGWLRAHRTTRSERLTRDAVTRDIYQKDDRGEQV